MVHRLARRDLAPPGLVVLVRHDRQEDLVGHELEVLHRAGPRPAAALAAEQLDRLDGVADLLQVLLVEGPARREADERHDLALGELLRHPDLDL